MIRKTLQPRGLFLWQLNLGFGLAKSLRPQVRARKGAEWVDIAEFFHNVSILGGCCTTIGSIELL